MVTTTDRSLNGVVIQIGTFIQVTVTSTAAAVWPAGAILGRVTASKKYVRYTAGATDGSEVPSAVLTQQLIFAASGDLDASVAAAGEFRLEDMTDSAGAVPSDLAIFELRTYGIFAKSTRELTFKDNQ